MSKPRDDWWFNAVRMVRNYPARKQEYEQLHSQSLVADISGMPRSGDSSRTTENIALRQMPPAKQQEYDAVTRAIEITEMLPSGSKRIELIERMYWKGRKLNIDSVIIAVGVAEVTGKRWHGAFIRLVGECFGYIN